MSALYDDYAEFWPLVSPVHEYEGEAEYFGEVLAEGGARTVLELGSGGGHNAAWLKRRFALTLVDLSPGMVEASRRLNPECRHVLGDMRTLRLGELFDAVFVHDAIEYMTSEADLSRAIETVAAHCRPGGRAVIVPDAVRERFEPSTDCGGEDGPDGSGARYLEWTWDPDPTDDRVSTSYSLVFRRADGRVEAAHEVHETGLFAEATWVALLERHGFSVEVRDEETDEEHAARRVFVARRVG